MLRRGAPRAAPLLLAAGRAAAHGAVQAPPSWHDPDGRIGMDPGAQCNKAQCMWYTNWTFARGGATIPIGSPLRTWREARNDVDAVGTHPWLAPGTAPISPCGHEGGNPDGCCAKPADNTVQCPAGSRCTEEGGSDYGRDARVLPGNNQTDPVVWVAGTVAEVAWALVANHGGGYAYRLCRKPAGGNSALTEACFQRGHLRFAAASYWVQYGADAATRREFAALRTDVGTFPAGSQWARNPAPLCGEGNATFRGNGSGFVCAAGLRCGATQFPPPLPGGQGLCGVGYWLDGRAFPWSIVDKLEVPKDLPSGDYVLSWRWDCEYTPQVWSNCADVRIRNPAPPPATPAPACPGGTVDACMDRCPASPATAYMACTDNCAELC